MPWFETDRSQSTKICILKWSLILVSGALLRVHFWSSVPGCRDKGDVTRIVGTEAPPNSRVENSTNLTSTNGAILGPIAIATGRASGNLGSGVLRVFDELWCRSIDPPR